jgi:DNA-binding NarL/FixJ family response regulator
MITIAIIDPNPIFRKSLKMMLEHINGFSVVLETGDFKKLKTLTECQVQVLLIDNGLFQENQNALTEIDSRLGYKAKSLILNLFRDEMNLIPDRTNSILKNSGKMEFESKIKKLAES